MNGKNKSLMKLEKVNWILKKEYEFSEVPSNIKAKVIC